MWSNLTADRQLVRLDTFVMGQPCRSTDNTEEFLK